MNAEALADRKHAIDLAHFRAAQREHFAQLASLFPPCPDGHTRTWMNVYRSGKWHTPGKDGAFDFHGGDNYKTWEGAIAAIEEPSYYICTAPIDLPTQVLEDQCVM